MLKSFSKCHLSRVWCVPVVLLIRTIAQFVADEVPERTRRPHCVARYQGKSEKNRNDPGNIV